MPCPHSKHRRCKADWTIPTGQGSLYLFQKRQRIYTQKCKYLEAYYVPSTAAMYQWQELWHLYIFWPAWKKTQVFQCLTKNDYFHFFANVYSKLTPVTVYKSMTCVKNWLPLSAQPPLSLLLQKHKMATSADASSMLRHEQITVQTPPSSPREYSHETQQIYTALDLYIYIYIYFLIWQQITYA